MKNVCHNCPDRWVAEGRTCHSDCKRYLDAKAEHEEYRAKKLELAMEVKDANAFKSKSIVRIRRRINGR